MKDTIRYWVEDIRYGDKKKLIITILVGLSLIVSVLVGVTYLTNKDNSQEGSVQIQTGTRIQGDLTEDEQHQVSLYQQQLEDDSLTYDEQNQIDYELHTTLRGFSERDKGTVLEDYVNDDLPKGDGVHILYHYLNDDQRSQLIALLESLQQTEIPTYLYYGGLDQDSASQYNTTYTRYAMNTDLSRYKTSERPHVLIIKNGQIQDHLMSTQDLTFDLIQGYFITN